MPDVGCEFSRGTANIGNLEDVAGGAALLGSKILSDHRKEMTILSDQLICTILIMAN